MVTNPFKIGDKVKYIGSIPELSGRIATVVSACEYDIGHEYYCHVDFGIRYSHKLWNCHGIVPSGCGILTGISTLVLNN